MLCQLKEQKISSMPARLEGRDLLLFIAEGIGEGVEIRGQSQAVMHFRLQVL